MSQKRYGVFLYAAIAMLVTTSIGFLIYFNKGFPNQQGLEQANYKDQALEYKDCDFSNEDNSDSQKFCLIGANIPKPSFLLWRDSHAGAQAKSIHISASQKGLVGLLTYDSGCPPLTGIKVNISKDCVDFNEITMEYIESHPEFNTILIAGRWALYAEGIGYKEDRKVILADVLSEASQSGKNSILFERGLTRTVEKLLALTRKVVIISQVPEIKYDVPSALFIAHRTGRDANQIISPSLSEYLARNKKVLLAIDSIRKTNDVQVVDPWKALCNEYQCLVAVDGTSLYMDATHLSFFGSQYISHIYDPFFEELANRSK